VSTQSPDPQTTQTLHIDIARDLADIAGHLASLNGEATSWLLETNYDTLRLRPVVAHSALGVAAVEARRRVRLNEGR